MDANRMARTLVGIILIILGLALAAYVGVWWALIGGIVQVVDAIKATPTDAWGIAYGAARVLCAGLLGTLTAVLAVFPGWAMLQR